MSESRPGGQMSDTQARLDWYKQIRAKVEVGDVAGAVDDALVRLLDVEKERDNLAAVLREITAHPVISEGEFPDDNCDWHCTAELVAKAESALAAQEDK
jgi:hypothetical protein